MTIRPARPYHHGNLRAELLAHAEQTLAEQGAANLSLRELARQTGVSHAAPRRHFAGKQALLDALAEDGFERLGTELRRAIAAAGDGLTARLLAFARAYVRFATEHAALLELMFAGKHRPDAERLSEAARRAFAAPLALIDEGQSAGEVVPCDPDRVAMVVLAALHGLAALANNGMVDGEALDDVVPEVVERLLDGVRPR
jgi:AcrR family transcriptional regulator